ncbi:hypothetical protein [Floccifex sp.]|uniref:hypothetical protein n=1 Tax=Floccifex sp. TaxID=2815810 RepID=UPI002A766B7B|nr:hypothetical protein [Floccifex sp.]MDD7281431.1 hypothetical protein [Erysipelotrichaceae bacterium]MDY2957811.1 hypothetical protein [Floccifex sp.]
MIEYQMSLIEAFFYHWSCSYPMATEKEKYHIVFQQNDKTGTIVFLGDKIVDLEIVQDDKIVFSLHFMIDDLAIVCDHFKSFFEFLNETQTNSNEEIVIHNPNIKKILFVCSSGVSSSYFAQKIEKELKLKKLDVQVDSTYLHHLSNCIEQYDIVFFAPQIVSHIHEYENYGVKVIGIHSYDFGSWNFNKIINMAFA